MVVSDKVISEFYNLNPADLTIEIPDFGVPVSYDLVNQRLYISSKHKGEVVDQFINEIVRALMFCDFMPLTGYKNLATNIATEIVKQYESRIFNENDEFDLPTMFPIKPVDLDALASDSKRDSVMKEIVADITYNIRRNGDYNFVGPMFRLIDSSVDNSLGKNLYMNVLETDVGGETVRGVLELLLGDRANELTYRNPYGWGSTLFSYAAEVGMVEETRGVFINRIKQVYQSSYGVAKEYFSKFYSQEKAHQMAIQAVCENPGIKSILGNNGSGDLKMVAKRTLETASSMTRENIYQPLIGTTEVSSISQKYSVPYGPIGSIMFP